MLIIFFILVLSLLSLATNEVCSRATPWEKGLTVFQVQGRARAARPPKISRVSGPLLLSLRRSRSSCFCSLPRILVTKIWFISMHRKYQRFWLWSMTECSVAKVGKKWIEIVHVACTNRKTYLSIEVKGRVTITLFNNC